MKNIESIYNIQIANKNTQRTDRLRSHLNEGSGFQYILKGNINLLKEVSSIDNKNNEINDKKLMNLCIQMESIFVAKMLKEMRNTIHKSNLYHGGFAEEIFEDMLYDEYSHQVSKSANLGIAKMIYEEISRK